MKTTITALTLLMMAGISDVSWGGSNCWTPKCRTVVQVNDQRAATVTLVVRGMMKSKSGAT